jgi:mRNA interferase YafQ
MYERTTTKQYRKAFKRVSRHRNFNREEFDTVVDLLSAGTKLPPKYKDHQLIGSMKEYRECHIQNDLLLVYQKHNDILILLLIDIGSHSEVFG